MMEQDNNENSIFKDHGFFILLMSLVVAVLINTARETYAAVSNHQLLTDKLASQEHLYNNSRQMRSQLDSIALGSATLAQQGNQNAQKVLAVLQEKGVKIKIN